MSQSHTLAVQRAADPEANRHDWAAEVKPTAAEPVPDGYLLIKMANSQAVSAGNVTPGQVLALPYDEARALVRQGLAREVRTG